MKNNARLAVTILGLSLALIAGCQDRQTPPTEEGETTAPEAPVQAPEPARVDRPVLRDGLWQVAMSLEGLDQVQISRMCVDAAMQSDQAFLGAQAAGQCRQTRLDRQADGSWRFGSVCDMGSGGTTTTEGVASGDFQTRYRVEATSTTTGAAVPPMNRTVSLGTEASWQGPCPAGWRVGDVELQGGPRVNVLEGSAAGRAP